MSGCFPFSIQLTKHLVNGRQDARAYRGRRARLAPAPRDSLLLEETDGCPSSCASGRCCSALPQGRVWAGNGAQRAFRSAPGMSVRELGESLEGSSV